MIDKITKILFIVFFIIFFQENLNSMENKIIIKINDEIITSLDLEEEIKYLKALNPGLNKLNNKEIIEISKKSILRENIKQIEIFKNFENPKVPLEILDQLVKNIYSKIGINNLEDFKNYLNSNQIDYRKVLNKIEIEALWNELIFLKYSEKIKIDKNKLREEVKKNINRENKSYLMSEIIFEVSETETAKNKYKKIRDAIADKGFENAALIYSISETANIGGKLNWINESSLNNKIRNILKSKKRNEFTEPITIPGGFLILQINEIKYTKSEINADEELEKLINIKKNNQLNQFSKIYFNRVKEDMSINEI